MGAQQAKETKSGKRERKTKDNRQIIQNFAQDSNGKFGASGEISSIFGHDYFAIIVKVEYK